MSIWYQQPDLNTLAEISRDTMSAHLGMRITEIGDTFLRGRMPVDHRTVQPAGLLHGGASVALAETLGSVGATLTVNPETHRCVGVEINANHLRPVTGGEVEGFARPLHLGNSLQVWEIRIYDGEGNLACVSRLTVAVLRSGPPSASSSSRSSQS